LTRAARNRRQRRRLGDDKENRKNRFLVSCLPHLILTPALSSLGEGEDFFGGLHWRLLASGHRRTNTKLISVVF
jgi:hypothetical protein